MTLSASMRAGARQQPLGRVVAQELPRRRGRGRASARPGTVGSPSTTPAVSTTPASTRSTIDGRRDRRVERGRDLGARAGRGRTPSRPAAPEAVASIAPSAARSSESGSASSAAPSTRSRSRSAVCRRCRRDASSGRIGAGGVRRRARSTTALEPRVEEGDRVGVEVAPVERCRRGACRGRATVRVVGRPP